MVVTTDLRAETAKAANISWYGLLGKGHFCITSQSDKQYMQIEITDVFKIHLPL